MLSCPRCSAALAGTTARCAGCGAELIFALSVGPSSAHAPLHAELLLGMGLSVHPSDPTALAEILSRQRIRVGTRQTPEHLTTALQALQAAGVPCELAVRSPNASRGATSLAPAPRRGGTVIIGVAAAAVAGIAFWSLGGPRRLLGGLFATPPAIQAAGVAPLPVSASVAEPEPALAAAAPDAGVAPARPPLEGHVFGGRPIEWWSRRLDELHRSGRTAAYELAAKRARANGLTVEEAQGTVLVTVSPALVAQARARGSAK